MLYNMTVKRPGCSDLVLVDLKGLLHGKQVLMECPSLLGVDGNGHYSLQRFKRGHCLIIEGEYKCDFFYYTLSPKDSKVKKIIDKF